MDESLLTYREFQVLVLVSHGKRSKEIADTLFLSHLTVKNHLAKIYKKLGVPNRTAASSKYLQGEVRHEPDRSRKTQRVVG